MRLVNVLSVLIFQAMGLFLAINLYSPVSGPLTFTLFFACFLTTGYIVKRQNFSAPWMGLQWASPLRYIFEALVQNGLEGRVLFCTPAQYVGPSGNQVCPRTTGQNVLDSYEFDLPLWLLLVVPCGILCGLHVVNYLTLHYRNWRITEH